MKLITIKLLALAAVFNLSSCASGPNAQMGTVAGGLGGAVLGGVIGHQSGRGLEGAAIGGALGATGGNMVGNASDQRNAQYYRQAPPPPSNYGNPYYR